VDNSRWKRLWTCRKAEGRMSDLMSYSTSSFFLYFSFITNTVTGRTRTGDIFETYMIYLVIILFAIICSTFPRT